MNDDEEKRKWHYNNALIFIRISLITIVILLFIPNLIFKDYVYQASADDKSVSNQAVEKEESVYSVLEKINGRNILPWYEWKNTEKTKSHATFTTKIQLKSGGPYFNVTVLTCPLKAGPVFMLGFWHNLGS